jgi:hypothetical protein
MVLINVLDEGLDEGLLDEFLLRVRSLDLEKIAGDSCYKEMRESIFLDRG